MASLTKKKPKCLHGTKGDSFFLKVETLGCGNVRMPLLRAVRGDQPGASRHHTTR